ncbi:MAG TPA: putative molybdenum carrier protein [Acidobacteriota bacterium]|nr:putative molybdenum carrier protein [Acidobacteriota bacterium]
MAIRQLGKIVSGGQSGVDRAALDRASEAGLARGGWCPRGRRAEDGAIDPAYPLRETPSAESSQRTEWNVRDSDATLVLTLPQARSRGTDLTLEVARRQGRPCRVVDLERPPKKKAIKEWLRAHQVGILNVAGPRESEAPGVYAAASRFLEQLLNVEEK